MFFAILYCLMSLTHTHTVSCTHLMIQCVMRHYRGVYMKQCDTVGLFPQKEPLIIGLFCRKVWYSVSWDITSCNVSCLSHTHTLYHVHTSHTLYNVYSSLSHTHCIMYTECESDIILRECLTHTVYTLYSVYMMSHTHCIIYTPRTYTVGSLAK